MLAVITKNTEGEDDKNAIFRIYKKSAAGAALYAVLLDLLAWLGAAVRT